MKTMLSMFMRKLSLGVGWFLVSGAQSDPSREAAHISLNLREADLVRVIKNAEGDQQPHDDADHHDDIENVFDLPVHRDVGIDQPEQHADDD
jgi:hypothetical protein